MNDVEFAKELVRFFGWRRSAELVGVCTLMVLSSLDPEAAEETLLVGRTTWWRVRRDLKRLGDKLRAEGKLVDGEELTVERVRRASAGLALAF